MIVLKELLNNLKIPYKDITIYEKAFTHSSYANEHNTTSYERLEFLGDAVLELVVSDHFYNNTKFKEGKMTVRRAQAVREEALVLYSEKIGLKNYIKLGHGEEAKGPNDAIVADVLEALFAAVYLDLGLSEVKKLFKKVIEPYLKETLATKDYKSTLQEIIHSGSNRNISYQIVKESGPSHNKKFEAIVLLDKTITLGKGTGKTKKDAEQKAAEEALKRGSYDFTKTI